MRGPLSGHLIGHLRMTFEGTLVGITHVGLALVGMGHLWWTSVRVNTYGITPDKGLHLWGDTCEGAPVW